VRERIKVIDINRTELRVDRVGLNAQTYAFALDYSFSYGLMCVFFAVFSGWFINAIRNQ
jgi:hypothetical protein